MINNLNSGHSFGIGDWWGDERMSNKGFNNVYYLYELTEEEIKIVEGEWEQIKLSTLKLIWGIWKIFLHDIKNNFCNFELQMLAIGEDCQKFV